MTHKRFRLQFSLATLLILTLLCGAGMMWYFGRYGRWAADLADPQKRDVAFFNLLHAQRYHGKPTYTEKPEVKLADCKVNHVIVSPQADGTAVYAVFKASGWRENIPGAALGHIIVFDSHGYILPVFAGANTLDQTSMHFDVEPGQPKFYVDELNCSVGTTTVGNVYVVPISGNVATPELLIAYRRENSGLIEPVETPQWNWRVQISNGKVEIQLGPGVKSHFFEPRATYFWSTTQKRFVGPDGGPDQPFMRLDPARRWEQMREFAAKKKD